MLMRQNVNNDVSKDSPITQRENHLLFTTKFSSARQLQNHVELFLTFLDESRESQM